MARTAIGLGSNLGDRRRHLDEGLRALSRVGRRVAVSGVYETEPIGGPDQSPFLNAVAVFETALAPEEVMAILLEIENEHGRKRREHWGPRTLDLDLLLYDDVEVSSPGLTVPHPRLAERRFVLEPLAEAWPDAKLPDGTSVASLLPAVAGQSVERLSSTSRPVNVTPVVVVVTVVLALAMWWIIDALIG